MRLIEVTEPLEKKWLVALIPELQQALDVKGKNMAKASYSEASFFGRGTFCAPHIAVKLANNQQLILAATWNVVNKFVADGNEKLDLLGMEMKSTGSRSKICLWIEKK